MKGNKIKALAITGLVVTLGACSSMTTLPLENLQKKQVPDWYLEHSDKGTEGWLWAKQGMYYAVAVGVSPDMEMALKKATLKAKAKIADRINEEMNNNTSYSYTEAGQAENMAGRMEAQDKFVNVISETVLRTYGIEKKDIIYNPELRNYRAFVLMKITTEDIEKLVKKYEAEELAVEAVPEIKLTSIDDVSHILPEANDLDQ